MAMRALLALGAAAAMEGQEQMLRGRQLTPGDNCSFPNPSAVPYYWDPNCTDGMLGCNADGEHMECRFCREAPFEEIDCPLEATPPAFHGCWFRDQPSHMFGYYWEPDCEDGMKGCNADGIHMQCRWCGVDGYSDIECPEHHNECTFAGHPTTPFYWDANCRVGMLGCLADGIHPSCRFCAKFPFESVKCPGQQAPTPGECYFPVEPNESYYWDTTCELGMVGCWADHYHGECRFCGGTGEYASIPCPDDL